MVSLCLVITNLSSLIRESQAVPFELKQFDEMWIRAIVF